ncbi:MAG: hypothetical protein V4615_07205 [Bacteroidota bacterium]
MKKYLPFLLLITVLSACDKDKTPDDIDNTPTIENTLGFGLLNKVKGIWNGPVSSTTGLGSYPEWIVDFRPISENQISAKNELDSLNDIHMSFFIAKYNNQYKVCFRNGGSFAGMTRVSYFLADSVSETSSQSYYRFAEVIKGKNRAYTEVIFKEDSLIMKSYTNKSNSLANPILHMAWSARLQDTTSCQPAVTHFSFPKKSLTKDFSSTFNGLQETIFYSTTGGDPYPEGDQPYLGQATISYSFLSSYSPDPAKKVFLIITTQPLISGFTTNFANLKYRSRYVILPSNDHSFTFNYMHPGTYYLYAMYDANGSIYNYSGDWTSTTNATFTLSADGTATSSTQINFTIP